MEGADLVIPASAAAFGSLLPDIDAPVSLLTAWKVGGIRVFRPLSVISWVVTHRGPTHSLFALYAVGAGIAPIFAAYAGVPAAVALVTAYASHLLLDACTVSGIRFLWPSRRAYWLLPKLMRTHTRTPMGDGEQAVFAALGLSCVALFLPALL